MNLPSSSGQAFTFGDNKFLRNSGNCPSAYMVSYFTRSQSTSSLQWRFQIYMYSQSSWIRYNMDRNFVRFRFYTVITLRPQFNIQFVY